MSPNNVCCVRADMTALTWPARWFHDTPDQPRNNRTARLRQWQRDKSGAHNVVNV